MIPPLTIHDLPSQDMPTHPRLLLPHLRQLLVLRPESLPPFIPTSCFALPCLQHHLLRAPPPLELKAESLKFDFAWRNPNRLDWVWPQDGVEYRTPDS